jgi:NAD(P)-dependent dehydrogenase (short-subunit alcohol dehydrogenase family)
MAVRMPRLSGKVAVVTGASQGLGQYLSMELAAEGAQVVLVARNSDRLDMVCSAIEDLGGTAFALPADVSHEADCEKVIRQSVERFGGIDHLVLNAGMATYGRLDELETFAPIRAVMDVNFFGAAYPTYLALPHLVASKGLIAYVTSGSGHLPMAGYLGYTTSKHAMNGFFEALRLELIPQGVDVLTINPGDMYSDDGAGRAVFGPDGSQHKVDLSVRRPHDIPRGPASGVARQSLEAIVHRRRILDVSPRIQKFATVARTLAPGPVDRRIYAKTVLMRRAFTGVVGERRDDQAE